VVLCPAAPININDTSSSRATAARQQYTCKRSFSCWISPQTLFREALLLQRDPVLSTTANRLLRNGAFEGTNLNNSLLSIYQFCWLHLLLSKHLRFGPWNQLQSTAWWETEQQQSHTCSEEEEEEKCQGCVWERKRSALKVSFNTPVIKYKLKSSLRSYCILNPFKHFKGPRWCPPAAPPQWLYTVASLHPGILGKN